MIRPVVLTLAAFLPVLASAQTANSPEMHILTAATFNLACVATAPDLESARTAFAEAGMTEDAPGVFIAHEGQIVGFLAERNEGTTRTCAVGLYFGLPDPLIFAMDELSKSVWIDEFEAVPNVQAAPVYIKNHGNFVGTMTVTTGDPQRPVMNHISFSPTGFSE